MNLARHTSKALPFHTVYLHGTVALQNPAPEYVKSRWAMGSIRSTWYRLLGADALRFTRD